MIKVAVLAVIIALWILGGQWKGRIRDIGVPVVLALYFAVTLKLWWLFLVMGAGLQAIRLGYGNYDPVNDLKPSFLAKITHDRNGWYIRAIYGGIASLGACFGLIIAHKMPIWAIPAYIVGNIIIGYLVSRLRFNVYLADSCVAAGLTSLVWLI